MYGNLKRGEDTEQMGVIDWANWNLQRFPELKMLYHVPNGGKRNPTEAVRFKAMGVKAGVPDLCLPVPMNGYAGLYIEMKYGNNKPTAAQKEWIKNLKEYGYKVTVCYGGTEATAELEAYLQGSRTILTDPKNENCKPQKRIEIYCSSEDTENIRSALCMAAAKGSCVFGSDFVPECCIDSPKAETHEDCCACVLQNVAFAEYD